MSNFKIQSLCTYVSLSDVPQFIFNLIASICFNGSVSFDDLTVVLMFFILLMLLKIKRAMDKNRYLLILLLASQLNH